ncbi:TIGR03790 family protein [Anthocerotibacter panamensis]|uniref:TIGR03790 family protein n=1 Tax=Anthocerotibacter panamensis TaxID=2857077 RepID=UPI001C401E12|nr:TIGR03790 family protein [Anthocerotibacter panamensis]
MTIALWVRWLVLLVGFSWVPGYVQAESEAMRVLVLANRNSPVSLRLARYYQQQRAIPDSNFLTLDLPDSSQQPANETISYATYLQQVEQPLRAFLRQPKPQARIRYLLLTKGVPLRVLAVPHRLSSGKPFTQTQALDATLAALDYRALPIELKEGAKILGLVTPNLYWRQNFPFSHALTGGYLVTRLDGYTEADARALVERALTPRPGLAGVVLLDPGRRDVGNRRPQPVNIFDPKTCTIRVLPRCSLALRAVDDGDFNEDLKLAARGVSQRFPQLQGILAPPNNFLTGKDLLGYVSWGSNDEVFKPSYYQDLQFLPGAVADTAVSTSARTFLPTQGGQSLVADLIAGVHGVTGVQGYSDEPYLAAVGSPSVLLANYFAGANLAEAFYRANRFVGWRGIVLGDPLATVVFPGTLIR